MNDTCCKLAWAKKFSVGNNTKFLPNYYIGDFCLHFVKMEHRMVWIQTEIQKLLSHADAIEKQTRERVSLNHAVICTKPCLNIPLEHINVASLYWQPENIQAPFVHVTQSYQAPSSHIPLSITRTITTSAVHQCTSDDTSKAYRGTSGIKRQNLTCARAHFKDFVNNRAGKMVRIHDR